MSIHQLRHKCILSSTLGPPPPIFGPPRISCSICTQFLPNFIHSIYHSSLAPSMYFSQWETKRKMDVCHTSRVMLWRSLMDTRNGAKCAMPSHILTARFDFHQIAELTWCDWSKEDSNIAYYRCSFCPSHIAPAISVLLRGFIYGHYWIVALLMNSSHTLLVELQLLRQDIRTPRRSWHIP